MPHHTRCQPTDVFQSLVNRSAINIFNFPPPSYCSAYSNLSCTLPAGADTTHYSDSAIRALLESAHAPSSVCPVTGITVTTPFKPPVWAAYLIGTHYPNQQAAQTLVKCLREGVALGFTGDRTLTQIGPNLPSAAEHPDAVSANITKETHLQRRHGPYTVPPFTFFYSNPLGVVFKRASAKPRVVHHLSWPRSYPYTSVNAATINFEIALDAFDIAIRSVRQLGAGCFMIKLDIE